MCQDGRAYGASDSLLGSAGIAESEARRQREGKKIGKQVQLKELKKRDRSKK